MTDDAPPAGNPCCRAAEQEAQGSERQHDGARQAWRPLSCLRSTLRSTAAACQHSSEASKAGFKAAVLCNMQSCSMVLANYGTLSNWDVLGLADDMRQLSLRVPGS